MPIQTENPFNFEKLASYDFFSRSQLDESIERNFKAWQLWKSLALQDRCKHLLKISVELKLKSELLAQQMSLEMGKPLVESKAEIEKSALCIDYVAKNFPSYLEREEIPGPYVKSWTEKNSVGPVLTLMPWNYPLWQLVRFAAPGLLSGNTVLFKGAVEVLGTSYLITEIFQKHLPSGVFEQLVVEHSRIEKVISDPRVRGVTFTGSVGGGRAVAELAGRHLKKSVMELGGNDAYLLLPDCDLRQAAKICAQTRLVNNGQSCISGKRFFVQSSQLNAFFEFFKLEMQGKTHGDPLDPKTDLGPLASRRHHSILTAQVDKLSKDQGAQLIWKKEMQKQGAQFAPQIWAIQNSAKWIHEEEFFGPVALVFQYENVEELPGLVNQSSFGLGAGILGKDKTTALQVAKLLEVGMVVFNDYLRSDVRMPFGGVKNSGFGRELSQYGLVEFCNIQSYGETDSSN